MKELFSKLRSLITFSNIYKVLLLLIKISLVIAFAEALLNRNWLVAFVSGVTFLLLYLPDYFTKATNIKLPLLFEVFAVVFIYASLFLGEVHNYYTRYWWWDLFLHGGSALVLGIAGFTILYVLYRGKKITAKPWLIAFFSFSFALAIGALWEIFEFGMDQIFGLNMQKSGLVDTMWDLIVDSLGAFIGAIAGYIYLKTKESVLFGRFIDFLQENNPHLFHK